MVQTTQTRLERLYQVQNDRDTGMYIDSDAMHDARASNVPVDLDFQQALDNSAGNL